MSEFTKGPWRIDQGAIFGDDGVDYDRMVASLTGYTRNFEADLVATQNKANAHLIAAAPDMYEALKAALGWMEMMEGVGNSSAWVDIKDAIAKAEGDQC